MRRRPRGMGPEVLRSRSRSRWLGPAGRFHQFPSANPTPLGWQANGVRREPKATENTVRRFPPGAPARLRWESVSLIFRSLALTTKSVRLLPRGRGLGQRQFHVLGDRVFRDPSAAEPRMDSLLPREGEVSCIGPSSRAQVGAFTAH
ncbi:MAG: hypothetical protein ACFWUL_06875 [Dialister sp.]